MLGVCVSLFVCVDQPSKDEEKDFPMENCHLEDLAAKAAAKAVFSVEQCRPESYDLSAVSISALDLAQAPGPAHMIVCVVSVHVPKADAAQQLFGNMAAFE